MKNNKVLFLVAAVVVIVIIVFVFLFLKKKKATATTATPATLTTAGNSNGQVTPNIAPNDQVLSVFPLKRGSNHKAVEYLQMALNTLGLNKGYNFQLKPDGDFGEKTENALLKLYGIKSVDKFWAGKIADASGISSFKLLLQYIK